ncbi:MAG: hypothetical protein FOGNACKC_01816 [Anaerolineae bacterium]|nr:hypothetical protein [Anaerolineae bacterium]
MMKTVKIIGLGVSIWLLSLLWPQVNQWLSTPVMLALLAGLGSGTLSYIWFFRRRATAVADSTTCPRDCRPRDLTDTRPLKPVGMA